jgi:hypothetical protein
MKTISCIAVAFALVLTGCGEKSSSSGSSASANTNSSSGNPLNAPADYLRAVSKGQQDAVKTVGLSSVKSAIDAFSADKGRYPKDLDELVSQKYLPKIPDAPHGMKMGYDANTGTVSMEKQ